MKNQVILLGIILICSIILGCEVSQKPNISDIGKNKLSQIAKDYSCKGFRLKGRVIKNLSEDTDSKVAVYEIFGCDNINKDNFDAGNFVELLKNETTNKSDFDKLELNIYIIDDKKVFSKQYDL